MAGKLKAKTYASALYEATKDASRADIDARIERLVRMLAAQGRLAFARTVAQEFKRCAQVRERRWEGEVISAKPLSEHAHNALGAALSKKYDAEIVLTRRVDPSVMGGVRVRFDHTVIDGTVSTQLADLKKRFLTE